jgi:acyl carrier protein
MKDTIIKLIRNLNQIWEKEIADNTNIHEDLKFDTLDSVQLLIECETKFKITIQDNQWEKCNTIKDIVDIIEKEINTHDRH